MANTFINKGAALVTGGTDVYTCPGGTAAIVNAVYVSNIDGTNSADVNIKATIDGGSTYMHIAKTIPVPPDSTLVLDKPVNLAAADKIHFTASANSDLECFLSILEIT